MERNSQICYGVDVLRFVGRVNAEVLSSLMLSLDTQQDIYYG